METLQNTMRAVATEYARLTTQLLGLKHPDWVGGETFGLCIIDDEIYLTLEEMQVIIDNLDHWVSIYGTREKVADTIREWQAWWQDEVDKLAVVRKTTIHEYFYPNINLKSWLMGLRETKAKRNSCEVQYLLRVSEKLVEEYGRDNNLRVIVEDLRDEYTKAKAEEDAEIKDIQTQLHNGTAPEKMQRAYDEFRKDLD